MRRVVQVIIVLVGGAFLGVGSFLLLRPGVAPAAPAADPTSVTTVATTTTVPVTSSTAGTTLPPPPTTVAAGAAGGRDWITIQGAGDTNFDPSYIPNFLSYGYSYAFGGLDGLFLEDDLTVVNLECAASPLGEPLEKEFTFRCDPRALPVAHGYGVDVMNLANNHSGDFGTAALLDSAARVTAAGIAPVGVGADLAEATRPAVFDVGGWKVAVVGMGGIVPSWDWLAGDGHPGMASGDDIDQMVASVRAASEVADLVVVTIHWGVEGETAPTAADRAGAEALVAAGADVIFGHHPHRLGDLEFIDGTPVFWTLGNFVWPRLSDASATTGIGRVVVSPDGGISACVVPAFIETSGRPVLQGDPPCSEPG